MFVFLQINKQYPVRLVMI